MLSGWFYDQARVEKGVDNRLMQRNRFLAEIGGRVMKIRRGCENKGASTIL